MALIAPKQIDLASAGITGGVRFRVPVGVIVTIADGFQYVVHNRTFPVQGEVVIQGDGELVVHG